MSFADRVNSAVRRRCLSAALWILFAGSASAADSTQVTAVTTAEEIVETLGSPRTRGLVKVPGSAPQEAAPSVDRMAFPNVQFALNSAQLLPEARAQLDEIGRALAADELAGLTFEVRGHTDISGGPAFNVPLSRARAAAVRGYLLSRHAIAADRLSVRGMGATELRRELPAADPAQRRVELIRR